MSLERKPQCDWAYRTTAGLTMGCILRLDHKGMHLDSVGRWWTTDGEGKPVTLVGDGKSELLKGNSA